METEDKYVKGYNSGYFIMKYEVDLSKKIENNLPRTNDFLQGFFDGCEQLRLENMYEQLLQLKGIRNSRSDLEKDFKE